MKNSNDCKNCIHAVLFLATCKEVCGADNSIKTELIEGCEFCRDGKEKMPEDGEFNYCFVIEDNELWAWDAYLDGGAAMKINYCPMCGKKLVE